MARPWLRWLSRIGIAGVAVVSVGALLWAVWWLWSLVAPQWDPRTILAIVIVVLPLLTAMSWQHGWQWLFYERDPITWAALRARLTLTTLPLPKTIVGRLGVGVLLLMALLWYASEQPDGKGGVTYPHASLINPILGGLGALFLIYAAIRQARTAAEQAKTASDRHEAQTKADLQRRITESFSKAIEQLGSDKVEVRLGGIYGLERISKESPDDYWTVMETLTAFVRERTQRTAANPEQRRTQRIEGRAFGLWEEDGRPEGRSDEFWRQAVEQEPPEADIAAVLTVIMRRSEHHRAIEAKDDKALDFRQAVLRSAHLRWRISNAPTSARRISNAPTSTRRISNAPTSSWRISKAPTSTGRISKAPTSAGRISKAPSGRISKAPTSSGASRRRRPRRGRQADAGADRGGGWRRCDPAAGGLTRPARWTAPPGGGAAPAR